MSFETKHRTKQGVFFPVEVTSNYLEFDGKEYSFGFARDITARKQAEEALSQERNLLRTLIDNVPDFIFVKDVESRMVVNNVAHRRLLGVGSEDEAKGKTDLDFFPPGLAEQYRADDQAVILSGLPLMNREETTVGREGNTRWLLTTKVPWLGRDGKIAGIVGISRDITQRKRAEEALRASEARYRLLFETNVAVIIRNTIDGRIVDCNGPAARILGYESPREMLGLSMRDLHWDSEERVELMARLQAEGTVTGAEVKFRHKDGRPVWLIVNLSLTPPDDTGERFVQGTLIEITARKQAEEALSRERNLLRTLIDNLPDYVYVKDTESRFLIANAGVARLAGAAKGEDLLGKTDFDFFSHELAAKYRRDEEEVIRSGQPMINGEEIAVDATDKSRWLLTTKVPLRNARGDTIGLVGIGRDITERKQAEIALQASERRYRRFLERNAAGVIRNDLDGTILDCNDSMVRILGYDSQEELKSQRTGNLYFDPDDRQMMLSLLRKEKVLTAYEFRFKRKDGTPVWFFANMTLAEEDGREVIEAAAVDITERKRAEEALRASESRYRLLFENNVAAIVRNTLEGRIVDCNDQAARILGYESPQELMGISMCDVY
jgi:PAS domain S-box-containing protein